MKIAFYNPLFGSKFKDLTKANQSNPGWGGTQFCFALIINALSRNFRDLEIMVYSDCELILPINCKCKIVDKNNLFVQADRDGIDYLVVKTFMEVIFYREAEKYKKVNIICWSHNYFNAHIAKAINECTNVKAVVFVGKQMYDFYYDHDIILKSTFIYNPVPDRNVISERIYEPYTLVYMGSLIRQKGILDLLKIWHIIETKYPHAQLNIIGAGNLYKSDAKLGPLGVAEKDLEMQMANYIYESTGRIKANIHFHGILGDEKYNVFQKCAVGIVNPSARTETFGMGIMEMATVGLPVVTKGWNGHLDTIVNGETGLLAFTNKGMAHSIIRLFEHDELNRELGQKAKLAVKRFDPDKISYKWHDLFYSLNQNHGSFNILKMDKPYWNNYKFIRYLSSFFRHKLGLKFLPSVVEVETFLNDSIKRMSR